MADSDNTRVCLSVTRRMLLTGMMATTTAIPFRDNALAAAEALAAKPVFDPALVLWRDWKAAYLNTAALCRKQQRLETRLAETIGFPSAEVYLPDDDVTVSVSWHGDIEELFGDDPKLADLRAEAEADLAAHQARWDEADARIGYSAAKREERAAADHEQELVDTLMAMPATTLAGVAGKLDAVLREGESFEECEEFPWPQIRSALVDLVRIAQALQPGIFMPGADRKGPYPKKRREAVCPSVIMHQRGDRVA
ncbi:hypothetical protein SAZ10_10640 [Mesorhizobium sp. BAC0120]|uniref:hypothetical protein n=1 Tax=Mesorhizobium sp. BAC0120 TaxID=3090670 RepID=UPI00298CEC5C|nr:hypothetical protein [Mesorhizobium sp. BAC0120]MDW6022210.1 hypothetical protein [Mesorhizobium sp. BAC0120]